MNVLRALWADRAAGAAFLAFLAVLFGFALVTPA